MAISRLFILVLFCIGAMPTNADATHVLALDFALNPTLPSAQGMSFYTDSGRPESDLVSIVGGNRLKLDSYAASGDRQVYYYKDNVFDHTIDLEMEIRLKILNSGSFGFFVVAYNPNVSSNFVISKDGWRIYGVTSGSGYDFSQGFNTFKYRGYAGTNSYEFFVNGSLVASGTRPSGYAGNQLYFGDGTPTGDNVTAEIQYLKYSNQPFSSGGEVPEPLSLAIWSLVAGGFVSCKRGRNPWQGALATWLSARSLRGSALFIPTLILTLSLTGCGDGRTGSSSKSSSQNSVPASKGPAGSQNQDSDKSYPVAEGPIE